MSPLETAVVFLGLGNLAGPAAAAYIVRRLAAWPKPPAPQQPAGQSRRAGQPADGEHAETVNGTVPPGGTS
jgi:hypothetical protein